VSIVEDGRMRSRRVRSRRRAELMLAGLLASVLAGCGVPVPPTVPDTSVPRDGGMSSNAPVDRLIADDDGSAVLTAQLETITALVSDVEALLLDAAAAAGSGDTEASRAHGASAVALMVGSGGGGEGRGLVPAIEPDRGRAGSDDLITTLITVAGDVGGERSRLVLELVRDPMLGDLGAWLRDPVGVITLLRAAADSSDDAAALDAALLELPGELTRALGFALAVASTDDPALALHAARQASGRLGVVLVAIELAAETLEARG
jgi:hypothetical protein